jgi:HPt (histidine-containing phosphotransfer) domain-containing protein
VGELVAALSKCQPRPAMEIPSKLSEDVEGPVLSPVEGPVLSPVEGPAVEAPAAATAPSVPAKPEPVETVSLEVMDPRALKQLRDTLGAQADGMLPGLIERFYQDVDRLLGEARQTLEQGEVADLHRAAHTLKSTSATFGAVALSAVARELEYLASGGVLEGAAGLIAQAEAEFVKAKAALETMREEL